MQKPDSLNEVADALSRAPLGDEYVHEDANVVAAINGGSRWGTLISRNDLRAVQQNDGLCCRVSEWLYAHDRRDKGGADMGFDHGFVSYLLSQDGLLQRYTYPRLTTKRVAPQILHFKPLYLADCARTSFGITVTLPFLVKVVANKT